ncbi:MAG: hypothetical protein ACP5LQ_09280 [Candidatus Methanodesulfokora sp.]
MSHKLVWKGKGLSRVISEIVLIVTVVAAAGMLYYAWTSVFSPASKVASATVVRVEGSSAAGAIWVTVKNTGNVPLTSAALDYPGTGYTLSPTSFTLNPGDSTVLKITGTFSAGSQQYIHITLTGSGGAQVSVDATVSIR